MLILPIAKNRARLTCASRAGEGELDEVGIVIVDREQHRFPRRVVVGLAQQEKRCTRADVEQSRTCGVGAHCRDDDIRSRERHPATVTQKAVERAAGKGLEPGEVLRSADQGDILVRDGKRRAVDQADALDQTNRRLRRDLQRLGYVVRRRRSLHREAPVARRAADGPDQIGERAHRVEAAPDQPLFVGDESANAVLDVDEAFPGEDAHGLPQRRTADLQPLRQGHFADQPGAGLQLSGGDLLAHRIGDPLDQHLARRACAADLADQIRD